VHALVGVFGLSREIERGHTPFQTRLDKFVPGLAEVDSTHTIDDSTHCYKIILA